MKPMDRLNVVTDKVLWRIHEANMMGTSLSELAKANRVSLRGLKKKLTDWRALHNKCAPVTQHEMLDALAKVVPDAHDEAANDWLFKDF